MIERDSDVAKWLEAACYILAKFPDEYLHRLVEEAVDNIRGAQQEDGYINTYYTVSASERQRGSYLTSLIRLLNRS